jgi:hypothetical protein
MKKVDGQMYVEAIVECPNCDEEMNVLEEVSELLDKDHTAFDCDIHVECRECNTEFIINNIYY